MAESSPDRSASVAPVSDAEGAEAASFIEEWKADRETFKRIREAQRTEYNYSLKLQQHKPKKKPTDPDQLKVVTLDLYDNIRYSAAIVGGTKIYLDVQPQGGGASAAEQAEHEAAAEVAQSAMTGQVTSVEIGYPRVRRRVIRMSIAARSGAAKLEVVPGGPHRAEIVPREVDPGNLTWDPRFIHFNDFGCPRLDERLRVPLASIRANKDWKNTDLVGEDDGDKPYPDIAEPTLDRQAYEQNKGQTTLVVRWLKEEVEEEPRGPEVLAPQQWYMACAKCGFTEEDLSHAPDYDGSQLPEQVPCPMCAAKQQAEMQRAAAMGLPPDPMAMTQPPTLMNRIEVAPDLEPRGRRVDRYRRVIFAPFFPGAKFLRDGPWPKGLTNFPYLKHDSDPFPLEPSGNSQTSLNMDLQSLKNESVRAGFEQMDRNRDLLLVKEDALWDANHEPFEYGSGDFVAYVSSYDDLRGIQHFQGSGLNQAFPLWMDRMDRELGTHRGTGQFNISAQAMKGTPVGTIARTQESGDVPLDEQIRIFREDEEQFLTRWLEMFIAYSDTDRWVEVDGKDGARAMRLFNGSQMPPLRLRLHAMPDLNAVDQQALERLTALVGKPPSVIRYAGELAHLPRHVIEDLIRETALPPTSAGTGGIPQRPGMETSAGV